MKKRIQRFEDLEIWKESMRLASAIYRQFREIRDYGFKGQIQKAAVSVPSNIAEGYERKSNKEFIQFLHISRGSCGELRTQLYLAVEVSLIDKTTGLQLIDCTRTISAMISGLITIRKENS